MPGRLFLGTIHECFPTFLTTQSCSIEIFSLDLKIFWSRSLEAIAKKTQKKEEETKQKRILVKIGTFTVWLCSVPYHLIYFMLRYTSLKIKYSKDCIIFCLVNSAFFHSLVMWSWTNYPSSELSIISFFIYKIEVFATRS